MSTPECYKRYIVICTRSVPLFDSKNKTSSILFFQGRKYYAQYESRTLFSGNWCIWPNEATAGRSWFRPNVFDEHFKIINT